LTTDDAAWRVEIPSAVDAPQQLVLVVPAAVLVAFAGALAYYWKTKKGKRGE
jgi:hypothetical protein